MRSRAHTAWRNMKSRCYNPNMKGYKYYGGRGIKVCKRWHKFDNFLADMGEPPSKEHVLDRLKTSKDYSLSNCRWATYDEQADTRTHVRWLVYKGERKSLTQLALENKISLSSLHARLKRGWGLEHALTLPPGGGARKSK